MKKYYLIILIIQFSYGLHAQNSVAREWNEVLLEGIRNDLARPTVHARNLFHVSAAMYDAWAAYEANADTYFLGNEIEGFEIEFQGITAPSDIAAARHEAISYASYRLITYRFQFSPGREETLALANDLMAQLQYDVSVVSEDYSSGDPAALGNYIAESIIEFGLQDGSNEFFDYDNEYYLPKNSPLIIEDPGSQGIEDPNRWQPLSFMKFIDQSGNERPGFIPSFLSPEWGNTVPFSLTANDLTVFTRDNETYNVYHDPGHPSYINPFDNEVSQDYKWGFSLVSIWSSHLDPDDGILWDISPAGIGNLNIDDFPKDHAELMDFYNQLEGGDPSEGYLSNPITGQPYEAQMVPRGDYGRVLAEFWADGPDSETPPGHWYTILNVVNDHPELVKKFKGEGDVLGDLEWDVKSYFMLGGAMHDAAISAWSIKGFYDYIRPISAIRYMADLGQSTDDQLPNFNRAGVPLIDGYIELIDADDPIVGENNVNLDKIKLLAWKGQDLLDDEFDPDTDVAGVDWILAEDWLPYQRPTFVTPPFAGYVSGHSTYSRAAAEVLSLLTGSEYFPGGVGEFEAPKNEFLVFEDGPSVDVTLQWAKYYDASDQCSLSRIWGGIHPPVDDIPGRQIGQKVGIAAFNLAERIFEGRLVTGTDDELTNQINIYPNPVLSGTDLIINHQPYIKLDEVQLVGIDGKVLDNLKIENKNISSCKTKVKLPLKPTGLYILKMQSNQGLISKLLRISN